MANSTHGFESFIGVDLHKETVTLVAVDPSGNLWASFRQKLCMPKNRRFGPSGSDPTGNISSIFGVIVLGRNPTGIAGYIVHADIFYTPRKTTEPVLQSANGDFGVTVLNPAGAASLCNCDAIDIERDPAAVVDARQVMAAG